jgi:hypothetical protein
MPNNKQIGPQAPGYAAPQKSSGTDPGNRSTWLDAETDKPKSKRKTKGK